MQFILPNKNPPLDIDWDRFVKAGFEKTSEVGRAKQELKQGPELTPKDDNLFIRWEMRQGIKHYVVVCRCGNSRMLMHENGIRCHICGRFHSHKTFEKMKLEVKKLAKFEGAKILKNPQPFIEEHNRFNKQKYGITK